MFFKKFIIAIFLSIGGLMLFIALIRIGNNKKGTLGISDLVTYVEQVDFSQPVKNFSNSINTLTTSFKNVAESINITKGVTKITDVGTFFQAVGDVIGNIGNGIKNIYFALIIIITFPVQLLIDVFIYVGTLSNEFFKFVNWCITFEGYPPVNLVN